MTDITAGVVDVYSIYPGHDGWLVLMLRRAPGTRCPGSWETVHGRIEKGEHPEHAAVRELAEETGLTPERLYNVTVQPFYLHGTHTVQLAVVFAAFVRTPIPATLGDEHQAAEWLPTEQAIERMVWPRERSALREIVALLGAGDAGTVEDVMRIF